MISIKFISLFMTCAMADQSPWDGVNCGNEAGDTDVCQYGLELVYENPSDKTGKKRCCQKGYGLTSTFDDCKCLPCDISCDSTLSAQQQAYKEYKALNFTDADAKAASDTYICADSIFWPVNIPTNVQPVFKCCVNVQADHKCNCPPKDDTKQCYSKWSNPWLSECNFGNSTTGEQCCLDSQGACRPDQGTLEGFTDWAGCYGSSEAECNEKASQTREVNNHTQPSGCVYDLNPTQKYCGLEVQDDSQCQDARANFVDNNCGLGAVSDAEWFANRRLDANEGKGLQFAGLQAVQGAVGYCGSYWLEHPVTAQPKSEQLVLV